jgi:hypothetical protein
MRCGGRLAGATFEIGDRYDLKTLTGFPVRQIPTTGLPAFVQKSAKPLNVFARIRASARWTGFWTWPLAIQRQLAKITIIDAD